MNLRSKTKSILPSFQMTSMMDIVFLLLCFFVTTSVFSQWEYQMDITLPKAEQSTAPDRSRMPSEMIINVASDGKISVNGRNLSASELKKNLALLVSAVQEGSGIQPIVILRADAKTSYENVMKIIDICKENGIGDFTLATTKND